MELYHKTAIQTARAVTSLYSTSFYIATTLLEKDKRDAIYSIYGFVRFADEIVDTFHDYDQQSLIDRFEADLKQSLSERISLNPVLHAFQLVVNKYQIPYSLIDDFLKSMKADLNKNRYLNVSETEQYIYGSANVVGLMCLKVFTDNNVELYEKLQHPAMMLGSAFQKVNFLRDLKADTQDLNRFYFSNYQQGSFSELSKKEIIDDIKSEFSVVLKGIAGLPGRSKLAVLIAYIYYRDLLRKIEFTPVKQLFENRIRVKSSRKFALLLKGYLMYKFHIV